MTWIIFALIASLAKSVANVCEKQVLKDEDSGNYVSVISLVIALLSLPLLYLVKDFSVSNTDLAIIFIASVSSIICALTAAQAIKRLDLGESAGLFALSPLFVAIVAGLFLKESLGLIQMAGIGISVIGIYVLEHRFGHHTSLGVHASEQPIATAPKYTNFATYVLVFVSLIFFAVDATFSRYIVFDRGVDPILSLIIVQFFILIGLIAYDIYRSKRQHQKSLDLKILLRSTFWCNVLFIIIHRVYHMFALVLVEISILNAFKQISAVFTTIIAGEFLKEKYAVRRTIGSVLIVLGVIAVVVGA